MAYATGTYHNLERRIHELCESQQDFDSFVIERDSYLSDGAIAYFYQIKWEKELGKWPFTE